MGREAPGAMSSATRGVVGGGEGSSSYQNVIDYITIASTGNATDFGDLTGSRGYGTGTSDGTTGVFCGGYESSYQDNIDYITIASTGNATDFGDLSVARSGLASCSDSHGGL